MRTRLINIRVADRSEHYLGYLSDEGRGIQIRDRARLRIDVISIRQICLGACPLSHGYLRSLFRKLLV